MAKSSSDPYFIISRQIPDKKDFCKSEVSS